MAVAPVPPVPTSPTSSAPVPVAPPLSEGARLLNTFIAPSKTFTDLRRSAMWWGPFILLAIVWAAFTYTVEKKVGYRKITEDQIQMVPKAADRFEKLPAGEQEKQLVARTKGTLYFSYAKSVLRIGWFALIALVLFATFKLAAGSDVSYKHSLAVVVYASLPMVIQLILGIASLLAGMSSDNYSPDVPIATNPAYFMNPADSLVRYSLAAPFDLFAIWTLVLGWYVALCLMGVAIAAAFS